LINLQFFYINGFKLNVKLLYSQDMHIGLLGWF
jgi:hypothetical protein